MPEVRRRGLSDQLGVGADRTQRGASQGGGIGPTIARLQQAYRARLGSSSVVFRGDTVQFSEGTLDGSGLGSATFVVPDLGTTYVWVTAVVDVICGAGDDAELWAWLTGSSVQNHFGYGKQPSAAIGLEAVGATVAGRAAPGATIGLSVGCPLEASQSYTITFHASPAS